MTSVPHSGAKSVTHTPGKWMAAAKPSSIVGWPVVAAPMGQVICDVAIINKKPDHISDGEFSAYYAQVEANARLIAAAPDLLAALQGAIGALEFSQDYHRDLGNEDQAFAADRLDAARAAIAKATAGETRNAEPIHRRDGDEG